MGTHRSVSVRPLAAALALALGAGGMGANAGTPSLANLKAHMQTLHNAAAQAKVYLAQHRNDRVFFKKSHPHKTTRPNLHHPLAPAAATATVTSCVDDASSATTPGTLRYAVLNAANGDTIDLSACNNSTITLTQGALPVSVDGLTIAGGNGNNVTIDGNAADRVFYVTAPATYSNNYLTLSNLTVRNGAAPVNGGGFVIGGCIYAYNESVDLEYTTLSGCKAANASGSAGGGGIAAYGLYMYQSVISGSTVSATPSMSGPGYAIGGGAFVRGKYTTYTLNSSISGNTAQGNGANFAEAGGLWAFAPYLNDTRVANNRVEQNPVGTGGPYVGLGGGVVAKYGGTLLNSTISGNSAKCTTTSTGYNAACFGGGVVSAYLPGYGGGTLDIKYSTISGNSADYFGGGVLSKYGVSLTQSTIAGNSSALGAGITVKYNPSGLTAYNSTIARNTAKYVGGGVYLYTGGPFGNAPVPTTLASTIVANNQAPYGGSDLYLDSASLITVSGSNDLVMAATPNITLPAGTLNADPMLGLLNANGGPTQTMGLYPGSPALDAGSNPNAYANDQRGTGFPRVVGAAPDIGAFEGTVAPPVPAPTLSAWALGLLAGWLGWLGWRRSRTSPRSG